MRRAIKNFKEFTHRNPDGFIKLNLPISSKMKLIYIGTVEKLDYISDKFDGKTRIHTHKFTVPHFVFTNKERSVVILAPTRIDGTGIVS